MRSGTLIAIVGGVIAVVLLFCLFGGAVMGTGMWGGGHMWGWDGNGAWSWWGLGMMLIMMLFWVLVIAAIIAGIVWVVRQASDGTNDGSARQGQALNILRERYARGEITKEEFERMRQDLE